MAQTGTEVVEINYEKTIKSGWLIYKLSGLFLYQYLLFVFFFGIICVVDVFASLEAIKKDEFLFVVFTGLFTSFFACNLFFLNKLVKVDGKDKLRNKEDVMLVLKSVMVT